jgi:hypothetical protein
MTYLTSAEGLAHHNPGMSLSPRANRFGFCRRLYDVVFESQARRAQRDIDRAMRGQDIVMTDALERAMSARMFNG